MKVPPRIVVAYGVAEVPPHLHLASEAEKRLPPGKSAEVGRPGAPAAAIDLNRLAPLRLSELRHPFALPPVAQDLAHAATQFAFLRQHLIKLCGLWARPQASFIEAYFDALHAHVAAHETALMDRAGDLAGLVELAHWCFAAPMPLPRAHVPLGSEGRLAAGVEANTIRTDFLFRDSGGLVALSLSPGTPTRRERNALQRLEAAGIRVLVGSPPASGEALLRHLGADFADFTGGIGLPESPFHGMGIPEPA